MKAHEALNAARRHQRSARDFKHPPLPTYFSVAFSVLRLCVIKLTAHFLTTTIYYMWFLVSEIIYGCYIIKNTQYSTINKHI